MLIKHRNAFNDWLHSRDRMKPHNPHEPAMMTIVELAQGIICIGLVIVLLFMVWQVSTPAGIAEIERIALAIWEAV